MWYRVYTDVRQFAEEIKKLYKDRFLPDSYPLTVQHHRRYVNSASETALLTQDPFNIVK